MKLLLAHEIQLNASAGDDMNALHFCAMKGHAEPAKLLIAAGVCLCKMKKGRRRWYTLRRESKKTLSVA